MIVPLENLIHVGGVGTLAKGLGAASGLVLIAAMILKRRAVSVDRAVYCWLIFPYLDGCKSFLGARSGLRRNDQRRSGRAALHTLRHRRDDADVDGGSWSRYHRQHRRRLDRCVLQHQSVQSTAIARMPVRGSGSIFPAATTSSTRITLRQRCSCRSRSARLPRCRRAACSCVSHCSADLVSCSSRFCSARRAAASSPSAS